MDMEAYMKPELIITIFQTNDIVTTSVDELPTQQ